jgi:hypothetical protein
MKAILEFNLPDEQHEHLVAVQAMKFKTAISDYDNYLRSQLKYSELSDDEYKAYKDAREKLYEFLQEENLLLHD